ncbi:D-inositol-3-phosphate glycosyltransferase [Ornithinimicrobium pratense]|uniref:D-inositol-3-phosphate glycosyltransferase n=1 Tax=Ornithinimicrobium pratense TaxID=2593973 RepID=A0A5J6V8V7_9MICO|nr:D-inositol-3-phosphate glycosyltransferase [Ornithinimicrobium pratense]QFG69543.1 D-inositol-3-phosphate glycosyltransferase [Ornithinimicrobium pratense]
MSSNDRRAGLPVRVLMVSLHTSPLLTPGTGDAGGLNVYVLQTALHLARRGVAVDVATRATAPEEVGTVRPAPGVEVHHLPAGPLAPVPKQDLSAHVDAFAEELAPLRARVAADGGVVHSHYWLSGAAALRAAELTAVERRPPLVHTMHTMARVKNQRLAQGERPEPAARVRGEDELVTRADLLVVNTADERDALVALHGADPGRVRIVPPGVDLETFRPGPQESARAELGLPAEALLLLFVGRIQPLKAPDVLLRAAGELVRRDPQLRNRLLVSVLGGPSGSGLARPRALAALAEEEGLGGVVRFGETLPRAELARWYRAADLLVVPSHHESFGLVAIEALASGTPVVAARVGGLPHAVGEVGVLVDGHDPHDWADALAAALARLEVEGARWPARAVEHAQGFSWERTVDGLLDVYRTAASARHHPDHPLPDHPLPDHPLPDRLP